MFDYGAFKAWSLGDFSLLHEIEQGAFVFCLFWTGSAFWVQGQF